MRTGPAYLQALSRRFTFSIALCFLAAFSPPLSAEPSRWQQSWNAALTSAGLGMHSTGKALGHAQSAVEADKRAKELTAEAEKLKAEGKTAEATKAEESAKTERDKRDEEVRKAKERFGDARDAFGAGKENFKSAEATKAGEKYKAPSPQKAPKVVEASADGKGKVPIDRDFSSKDKRVLVCVGDCKPGGTEDPIGADEANYTKRGADAVRPKNFDEVIKAIRDTPHDVDTLAIDAHGGKTGNTAMPGIKTFAQDSPEFRKLYGEALRQENLERIAAGKPPLELKLLQCFGTTCAQAAADLSGSQVTAGTTEMSIPSSPKELSYTRPGGQILEFTPKNPLHVPLALQPPLIASEPMPLAPSTALATLSPGATTIARQPNGLSQIVNLAEAPLSPPVASSAPPVMSPVASTVAPPSATAPLSAPPRVPGPLATVSTTAISAPAPVASTASPGFPAAPAAQPNLMPAPLSANASATITLPTAPSPVVASAPSVATSVTPSVSTVPAPSSVTVSAPTVPRVPASISSATAPIVASTPIAPTSVAPSVSTVPAPSSVTVSAPPTLRPPTSTPSAPAPVAIAPAPSAPSFAANITSAPSTPSFSLPTFSAPVAAPDIQLAGLSPTASAPQLAYRSPARSSGGSGSSGSSSGGSSSSPFLLPPPVPAVAAAPAEKKQTAAPANEPAVQTIAFAPFDAPVAAPERRIVSFGGRALAPASPSLITQLDKDVPSVTKKPAPARAITRSKRAKRTPARPSRLLRNLRASN